MYTYVYDAFLASRKYEAELIRVEARLLELGLQGRIERLTALKSLSEIVRDAVKRGSATIVSVGNDQTVSRVVSAIGDQKVTFGIIPFGEPHTIADLLGVSLGLSACDVLSARIIERVDLGKAGGTYFLSALEVPATAPLELFCDGAYTVRSDGRTDVRIVNVGNAGQLSANPQDGVLETVVEPAASASGGFLAPLFSSRRRGMASVFPIRNLRVKSPSVSQHALIDGQTVVKTPFSVEVLPKQLRLIVGKRRRL